MIDKEKENSYNLKSSEMVDNSFIVSKWNCRHNQCLLLFFILAIAYSMRSCMGVALVAMVQNDNHLHQHFYQQNSSIVNLTGNGLYANYTGDEEENFEVHGFFNALLLTPPYPKFNWSKKIQDTSSSASFYGGWKCALICRMCQGLSQACILPSFHTVLGKWSPLEERGRMSAIIYGGQAIGTVLGLPITGFIASSPLGWPGIFRFYGILSGSIAVVIWFLLADTPALHKRISVAERRYIEEALGQTEKKKHLAVPWKKIVTHRGVLAIIVAHIGNTWGQLIMYSEVPSYMDKVMGVNIKANGLLTALPFMVMWFTNFFFSWLTDMLIVKKYLNVTQTRKLANSLGSVPAAIGLIALAYAPKNIYVVESILVIICSFKVAAHVGFHVNHVDISPNFAGTLMSISNFMSNLVGSSAPIIAGFILTDVTDEHLWRKVFFIAAGLYFFTNLVYVVFGSAELADWNDPEYEKVALKDDVVKKKHESVGVEENGVV